MAQDTPSRKLDQYIVRFPEGMRDYLKMAAAENNRSLNAELVHRLERTIGWDRHVADREEYYALLEKSSQSDEALAEMYDAQAHADAQVEAGPLKARDQVVHRIYLPGSTVDSGDVFKEVFMEQTALVLERTLEELRRRGLNVDPLNPPNDDK